jgi:hypothetical protein
MRIEKITNLSEVVKQVYAPEERSLQFIPEIYNHTSQGAFYCHTPGLTIRKLSRSSTITSQSDIIQLDDVCIFEKIFRRTAEKNIFQDRNLVDFNISSKELILKENPVIGRFDRAYSILGTNSQHWGHFIAEYFPSFFASLPFLPEDVVIVIPDNLDQIQIEFIKFALDYHSKENKIFVCPNNNSVLINELYIL